MKDFKILQIQLCPVKLQIFVLSNLRNVDIRWHWTYRRKYAALSPHQDTFTLNSLSPVPRNKAAKSVLTSPDLQTPGGEGGGNTGICVVWFEWPVLLIWHYHQSFTTSIFWSECRPIRSLLSWPRWPIRRYVRPVPASLLRSDLGLRLRLKYDSF